MVPPPWAKCQRMPGKRANALWTRRLRKARVVSNGYSAMKSGMVRSGLSRGGDSGRVDHDPGMPLVQFGQERVKAGSPR